MSIRSTMYTTGSGELVCMTAYVQPNPSMLEIVGILYKLTHERRYEFEYTTICNNGLVRSFAVITILRFASTM